MLFPHCRRDFISPSGTMAIQGMETRVSAQHTVPSVLPQLRPRALCVSE